MKTIEVDDEVYAYLQSKAIAFEEDPNLTLRRLFRISKSERDQMRPQISAGRSKKPKADLHALVKAGLMKEGQKLFLRDYQGHEVEGYEAVVSQGSLIWNGQKYSMSDLAKELLKKQGYRSDSVRGPMFWFTKDGVSIKDIWARHLKSE
jgi:predicted CopG family antitoxin